VPKDRRRRYQRPARRNHETETSTPNRRSDDFSTAPFFFGRPSTEGRLNAPLRDHFICTALSSEVGPSSLRQERSFESPSLLTTAWPRGDTSQRPKRARASLRPFLADREAAWPPPSSGRGLALRACPALERVDGAPFGRPGSLFSAPPVPFDAPTDREPVGRRRLAAACRRYRWLPAVSALPPVRPHPPPYPEFHSATTGRRARRATRSTADRDGRPPERCGVSGPNAPEPSPDASAGFWDPDTRVQASTVFPKKKIGPGQAKPASPAAVRLRLPTARIRPSVADPPPAQPAVEVAERFRRRQNKDAVSILRLGPEVKVTFTALEELEAAVAVPRPPRRGNSESQWSFRSHAPLPRQQVSCPIWHPRAPTYARPPTPTPRPPARSPAITPTRPIPPAQTKRKKSPEQGSPRGADLFRLLFGPRFGLRPSGSGVHYVIHSFVRRSMIQTPVTRP